MKILFTLLCINADHAMYVDAAYRLMNEILEKTSHDILISTNSTQLLDSVKTNNRIISRDNISNTNSVLRYGGEFNYNLKHFAFQDMPLNYDVIIYLDCDIKLEKWTIESENLIKKTIDRYEMGATRTNCVLRDEVSYLNSGLNCLFSHKITAYKIRETYPEHDPIYLSKLPSEHFLIIKNNPIKVRNFQKAWSELNNYLQSINGEYGSWGDGFEIGIAAHKAEITDIVEITHWEWSQILGLSFNGNKQ
jgi:hypothetical protein